MSHRRRGDASNVYRYLKKECAMTQARQWGAGPVRRRCYPWRRDRLRGIGRMSASGSGRNGRRSPDRPCPEYGSVALQPRRGRLRPLLCCASDEQQGGYRQAGLQCRARCRKARRYGREPRARSRICSRSRYHGSHVANAPSRPLPGSGLCRPLLAHKASRSLCSRQLEGCRLSA